MDTAEKTFLLELLLMDIRMSYTFPKPGTTRRDPRALRALVLAADLWDSTDMPGLADKDNRPAEAQGIDWTEMFALLAMYLSGRWEGSLLAIHYTEGGYLDLQEIHGLPFALAGRSDEFLAEVKKYIRTEYSWENPNVSL